MARACQGANGGQGQRVGLPDPAVRHGGAIAQPSTDSWRVSPSASGVARRGLRTAVMAKKGKKKSRKKKANAGMFGKRTPAVPSADAARRAAGRAATGADRDHVAEALSAMNLRGDVAGCARTTGPRPSRVCCHGAPACAADGGRGGRAPSAAGAAGDSAARNCANAKSTAPSCPDCGHLQDGGRFDAWLVYHGMFGAPTTPPTYPFARFGPPEFPFAWFAQVPRAAMLCNCARRAVGIEHWICGRFRLASALFAIDCMTDPESALLLRDVGVLDWAVAPVRSFADILSEPELDVLIGDSKALYYAALGDAHPALAGVPQVLVHASASRSCACAALREYADKCQSRTGDVKPADSVMGQWCCYGASLLLSACVGGALRACVHGRCLCALTQPL